VGPAWAEDVPTLLLDGEAVGRRFGTLVGAGGQLFFAAAKGDTNDSELWASDGTPEGTHIVVDPGGAIVSPRVANGLLFFVASTYGSFTYGSSLILWRSDGSPQGTFPVTGPVQGLQPAAAMGDALWFNTGLVSETLWRTDGTPAGTRMLTTVPPGDKSEAVERDGILYYGSWLQLWRTDGTDAGTRLLADTTSTVCDLTRAGDALYFFAGPLELWTSDGTPSGTFAVATHPTPALPVDVCGRAVVVGSTILYTAFEESQYWSLWANRRDGRPSVPLARGGFPFCNMHCQPTPTGPLCITTSCSVWGPTPFRAGEAAVFFGADGLSRTDGTPQGTRVIARPPALPQLVIESGEQLLFTFVRVDSTERRIEIWTTDGTEGGTRHLADTPDDVSAVAVAGDRLFFTTARPVGSTYSYQTSLFVMNAPCAGAESTFPRIRCEMGHLGSRLTCPGEPSPRRPLASHRRIDTMVRLLGDAQDRSARRAARLTRRVEHMLVSVERRVRSRWVRRHLTTACVQRLRETLESDRRLVASLTRAGG
jgi:ELWxxDGT repeat protein